MAFDRSIARESKIWTPFIYSFPFDSTQTIDRTTIFGLYSSAYLNRNKYLLEIETEDLANLLADYNTKMANLTNQEAIVVADIVSRRYVETVEKIIHDKKLETKRMGIEADEDIWDAKLAALASDTAALVTMAERVSSETQKTAAKITEIETYIEIEGIHLSEADIEISEKEIQSARVDLQKLGVTNDVLKIQIDTVKAAQELVDVDLRIARTKVDGAQIDRNINSIDLLDSELRIEQGRTQIAEAELNVAEARVALAQDRTDEVQAEIDYLTGTLTEQTEERAAKKIELMDLKQVGLNENLTIRRSEKSLANELRKDELDAELDMAGDDSLTQVAVDSERVSVMNTRAYNINRMVETKKEVAEIMATASIGTTLTHTIMKAETT